MTKPRRIVFVWNYLNWGGAQVYFLAIMKIARRDRDILVILPRKSSPEMIRFLEQLGIEYELTDYNLDFDPASTISRKLSRQLNRIKVEYRTFRRLMKFDVSDTVFHVEIAPWQSVSFLTAMSMRGAKLFLTLHNFLPEAASWRTAIWKARFNFVSRLRGINFFASNNDTKNRLRGWVTDEFWNRIRVTFTAVDPPQIDDALATAFDRDSTLASLDIPSTDFVVLSVGQFIDRKGRWVLLDAAREVLQTRDDISFVWLTPKLPDAADQKRLDDYGLGEKFRLVLSESVGTERTEILRFFRIADTFALPSFVEGLPIALLEAMALGRPSISTNVYAIPEAVKDGQTGILIEAGDSKALANAIVLLKDNAELRDQLARDGREFVLQNFDERDAAAKAISAYEESFTKD
ncbi:MAG TPA: glycosyltransferase family 4 protein [Pyrinomonadaceae bacterium]|nr:glycosyltransferase family 4 protein [Pyrinomonadaceae bacterium]